MCSKPKFPRRGILGTFWSVRSPGTAYVLLNQDHGRNDGAFRSWGFPAEARAQSPMQLPIAAREAGAGDTTQSGIVKIHRQDNKPKPVCWQWR